MKRAISVILIVSLVACASKPQLIVDQTTIGDKSKYAIDTTDCTSIAEQYDLSDKAIGNATVGALAGGAAVAGGATAIAGAVFWPAIPFIIAGTLLGGGIGGGLTMSEEAKAREKILHECMKERGYKVYSTS